MDLQKILREFLNVIDFKLLSFNTDSVIVQDINYHDIATEFLSIISNSNGSINIIDELFELYFCNILSKKSENEMLLQRKLEEDN